MKLIVRLFLLFNLPLYMASCGTNGNQTAESVTYQCPMKCEREKTYSAEGSCPICKMDFKQIYKTNKIDGDAEIAEESIFNLTSKWKTQNDETIELTELKGDVLVIVMIYTTCKAACPRLVFDMKSIHEKVNNEAVKYVLVSIDPETDTPERLKEFAIENEMDFDQWVFLQGTTDDVREFSNVLAVKYKQISPLDFSHSNIISVFDKDGVLHLQQEGLGVNNEELVAKILALN